MSRPYETPVQILGTYYAGNRAGKLSKYKS